MNTLNGSYWLFLSTVTLTQHPYISHALKSSLPHLYHTLLHSPHAVSLPLSPQITDGSRLTVHIILDDPAGSSYIQIAAK